MNTDNNRTRYPKSVEEAVGLLIEKLSMREKYRIAKMSQDDLTGLHFSLGLGIRKEFGLWAGNKDLLGSHASFVEVNGIHPDDGLGITVQVYWHPLTVLG